MKRITRIVLFALALFLFTKPLPAQNSSKNILFIFDASGSMWGKLGKSTKIEVARETMSKLVEKINPATHTGLIAYGHRSASDCNDIETLFPVTPLNKTNFVTTVKTLNPKGKTPIAKSITHALALIKGINDPVTVILVSDGLETCEGNACDIVKKAKASGIKITLHVVGFGIAEKDLSQLECIAQASGGQYFPANNAEELSAALEQTVKEVPKGDAFVSVKTTLDGKLKDASVKVYKKTKPGETYSGRTYESKETNPRILQLPAGTYEIEVQPVGIDGYATIKYSDVVVTPNETVSREIEFKQGVLEMLVTRNGTLSDATVQVLVAGTGSSLLTTRTYAKAETNPAKLKIPPGNYDIVVTSVEINSNAQMKFVQQQVISSGNLPLAHDFVSGDLHIGAKNAQGYVDATVTIHDSKTGKTLATARTYQSTGSNPKKFVLLPGNYRVDLSPVKPSGLSKKYVLVEITTKGKVEKIVEW